MTFRQSSRLCRQAPLLDSNERMKRSLLTVALMVGVVGCKKDPAPDAIDQAAALKPLPRPVETADAGGAVAAAEKEEDEDVDERRDDSDDLEPKEKKAPVAHPV